MKEIFKVSLWVVVPFMLITLMVLILSGCDTSVSVFPKECGSLTKEFPGYDELVSFDSKEIGNDRIVVEITLKKKTTNQ